MSKPARLIAAVPRLALTVEEACAALGVGEDFWREHVAPDVAIVRRGRRKLVAVAALEAWLGAHGERIADDLTGAQLARTANGPGSKGSARRAGVDVPVAGRDPRVAHDSAEAA